MFGEQGQPTTPARRRVGRLRQAVTSVAILAMALAGAALVSGMLGAPSARRTEPKVGAEVPVTAMDMLRKPSNNSPSMVADPTDSRFVVVANRLDAPAFGCALQVSGDGGRSWTGTVPVPVLPAGADTCYGPEVAFEASGALHYLFVGLQGLGNEPMGVYLTSSRDRGRTFTVPRQVLGPLNFGVRMALDPTTGPMGRMHLVWLHATSDPVLGGFSPGPNPVQAAFSDDGGVTFSEPVQVSDDDRVRVVAPALTLGPEKTVHVAYYDLGGDARDYQGLAGPVWEGTWSVVVATSLDGGGRFGPGAVVDDQVTPPERPMLIFTMAPPAVAADDRRTCAAWTDARHGDADVLLRCSKDRAQSWGDVRRVNDDPLGNGLRQYLPRLSFAPGGRLDVAFLDRRHHPNNDRIDVSYTSSEDGDTFAPNVRLTSEHSSAAIGAQYEGPSAEGQHEIGSRLGLLSKRSAAVVAWPDSRNSEIPGTAHDIFSVEVSRRDGQQQPVWVTGLGVALLGASTTALALLALGRRRRGRHDLHLGEELDAEDDTRPVPTGRRSGRGRLVWIPVVVVTAIAAATTFAVVSKDDPLFAGPEVVNVTMRDNQYVYRQPTRSGRVVFRVRNDDSVEHRIGIYLLPNDMPPIDEQLSGKERRSVDKLADPLPREPGEFESFAIDLVPGQRYALLCFLAAGGNKTYAELGMNSEFRTPAG